MPEDIIKAKWFNDSRGVIGIVRVVKEDLRPCYFIGTGCTWKTIEDDIEHISAWGDQFPTLAGDVLFSSEN